MKVPCEAWRPHFHTGQGDRVLAFYYDKSFEGLLSAVFDAYTEGRRFPGVLLGPGEIAPLLTTETHSVETDEEKVRRVFASLKNKLSGEGLDEMLLAWLSEEAGSDFLIFQYIRRIFDSVKTRDRDFSDPTVLDVHMLARKVGHEAHKLKGFVRFQQTAENIYCAFISPRHNVLPLLLRHFVGRYADQQWIIHDLRRHYGVMFDGQRLKDVQIDESLINGGRLDDHLLAEGEVFLQSMWKGYFDAVNIKERLNKRLQAGFMPRRYWQFLTELQ